MNLAIIILLNNIVFKNCTIYMRFATQETAIQSAHKIPTT